MVETVLTLSFLARVLGEHRTSTERWLERTGMTEWREDRLLKISSAKLTGLKAMSWLLRKHGSISPSARYEIAKSITEAFEGGAQDIHLVVLEDERKCHAALAHGALERLESLCSSVAYSLDGVKKEIERLMASGQLSGLRNLTPCMFRLGDKEKEWRGKTEEKEACLTIAP